MIPPEDLPYIVAAILSTTPAEAQHLIETGEAPIEEIEVLSRRENEENIIYEVVYLGNVYEVDVPRSITEECGD